MLRTNFQTTVYGNRSTIPHLSPEDPMPRSVNHMFHCMDYLRQTILCNADLTIEWEALTVKERLPTGHIDGYGVTHQCRDWVSFFFILFSPYLILQSLLRLSSVSLYLISHHRLQFQISNSMSSPVPDFIILCYYFLLLDEMIINH